MDEVKILRQFFPTDFPCPKCGDPERRGWMLCSHKNGIQYRQCKACGHDYRVRRIAVEVAGRAGGPSRILLEP